jgi:hypothetical protein
MRFETLTRNAIMSHLIAGSNICASIPCSVHSEGLQRAPYGRIVILIVTRLASSAKAQCYHTSNRELERTMCSMLNSAGD